MTFWGWRVKGEMIANWQMRELELPMKRRLPLSLI
jgi:hypothetical protein